MLCIINKSNERKYSVSSYLKLRQDVILRINYSEDKFKNNSIITDINDTQFIGIK